MYVDKQDYVFNALVSVLDFRPQHYNEICMKFKRITNGIKSVGLLPKDPEEIREFLEKLCKRRRAERHGLSMYSRAPFPRSVGFRSYSQEEVNKTNVFCPVSDNESKS